MTLKSKMDRIRSDFNKRGGSSGGGGDNYFNFKAGENGRPNKVVIRVLPPWSKAAKGYFYYTGCLHFGFSIGGRNRALACPEGSGRGKCPICTFVAKLKNSGEHEKLANQLRQTRRYWVNLIDRDNEDAGIKIWGTNKKFIETVLDASEDEDIGDITDPETGRDIAATRKGIGFNTRYSYTIKAKSTPVEFNEKDLHQLDKVVMEWIDPEQLMQYLIDNYADEMKDVGMKTKMAKKAKEEEEDEEEEKSKKKKVKKVVDEEEDEDEEDDDAEEDEDEEEDQDDEEEEEDVDDDEDEDED